MGYITGAPFPPLPLLDRPLTRPPACPFTMSISTRTYAPVVTPVYHTLPKEDTLFIIDAHARWSFLYYDDIERIDQIFRQVFGMPVKDSQGKSTNFWFKPNEKAKDINILDHYFGFVAFISKKASKHYWVVRIDGEERLSWFSVVSAKWSDVHYQRCSTFEGFLKNLTLERDIRLPPPELEDYDDFTESEGEDYPWAYMHDHAEDEYGTDPESP